MMTHQRIEQQIEVRTDRHQAAGPRWAVMLAAVLVLGALARPAVAATYERPAASGCVPNSTTLCLQANRFSVVAHWRTTDGHSGTGRAVAITADTGYFWFFSAANIEVVLKVLNGCSLNHRYWVFAGGLTNVQNTLTVTDTKTGVVKTYRNQQSTAFVPIQDTSAFSGCAGAGAAEDGTGAKVPEDGSALAAAAISSGSSLALLQGRFAITASWSTSSGQMGQGQAVMLTDETGYFWFFTPANVEMIIKVIDGCALNGGLWVFSGGLTDIEVEVRVTDSSTGYTKIYHNPQGSAFQPVQDTGAFYCSAAGLPPDPGAAGQATLAGIDSDHDGIRDDLQRYIVLNYGTSRATVAALRQSTVALQGAILDSGSRTRSLDHATDLARATECLRSLHPLDADQVEAALTAQALNTEQRGLAYLAFNDQLAGASFPINPQGQWAASCGAPATAGHHFPGRLGPQAPATSCTKTATIFFGNGVFNTCGEANTSTTILAEAVTPLLSSDERSQVGFETACNPTRGHLADLWRAYKQSVSSSFSAFWRVIAGLDPMPQSLRTAFLDIAGQITLAAAVDDPTLAGHIARYKSLISEGEKIVVTAHSQGNFYANLSSDSLTDDERTSFGIVAVADPDSRVAGGWGWTTFSNDLIVAAARPLTGALPGNAGIHLNILRDWTSHEFIASYMSTGSSAGVIAQQVHQELETLATPENPLGSGIITITLTWDHETDVDLHVFEPDGTHVYYLNLQGHSGFLDHDNVTGFGPEHYFVACNTLEPGTYHVGVNYFRGDAPETAHILVAAGSLVRSFDVALPIALGTDGNDQPMSVADIVVTGDAASGFDFAIQP
jgi:hypothetical protein